MQTAVLRFRSPRMVASSLTAELAGVVTQVSEAASARMAALWSAVEPVAVGQAVVLAQDAAVGPVLARVDRAFLARR